jgi:serine/threonine protein kinase
MDPQTSERAAAPAQPSDIEIIPIGTVLNDRYRIVAPLGLGGVGQVFDAIDIRKSKEREFHVTVKVIAVNLRHQPLAYAALEDAVRRSQSLVHPNIVAIYDICQSDEHVFVVMEPLQGRWLSGLVREVRGKGLAYEEAWPIIRGIANALAHAHKQGIVHCDLSPHAVFLCEDGTPKIMGFGLVHAVPNSNESMDVLDTLTLRAYTEAYTADAWAQQGTPHAADDLYPLGVIAYEMLAGKHPFQRSTLMVARQRGMKLEPIDGLNRRARKLIERCLAFERNVRPQDGSIFLKRMQPNVFQRLLAAGA